MLSASGQGGGTTFLAVQDGITFAYNSNDVLFAVDRNAVLLWSLPINGRVQALEDSFTILSRDVAVAQLGVSYQFINLLTGRILTSLRLEEHSCSSRPATGIAGDFVYDIVTNTINFVTDVGCLVSMEMNLNSAEIFEMYHDSLELSCELSLVHSGNQIYYIVTTADQIDIFRHPSGSMSKKLTLVTTLWNVFNNKLIHFGESNQFYLLNTDNGLNNTVECRDLATGKKLWNFPNLESYNNFVYSGGSWFYMYGDSGIARFALTWTDNHAVSKIEGSFKNVVVQPSGNLLLVHSREPAVLLLNRTTFATVWTVTLPTKSYYAAELSFDSENYVLYVSSGDSTTFAIDTLKGELLRTILGNVDVFHSNKATKWHTDRDEPAAYGFTFLNSDGKVVSVPAIGSAVPPLANYGIGSPVPKLPENYVPHLEVPPQRIVSNSYDFVPSVSTVPPIEVRNAFFYPPGVNGDYYFQLNKEGHECIVEAIRAASSAKRDNSTVDFIIRHDSIPSACMCDGTVLTNSTGDTLVLSCDYPSDEPPKKIRFVAIDIQGKRILWNQTLSRLIAQRSNQFIQSVAHGKIVLVSQFGVNDPSYSVTGLGLAQEGKEKFSFSTNGLDDDYKGPPGLYQSSAGNLAIMITTPTSFSFQEVDADLGGLGGYWAYEYDEMGCEEHPLLPYNGLIKEHAHDHSKETFFYWLCPRGRDGKLSVHRSSLNRSETYEKLFELEREKEKSFGIMTGTTANSETRIFVSTENAMYVWNGKRLTSIGEQKSSAVEFTPSMMYDSERNLLVSLVVTKTKRRAGFYFFNDTSGISELFSFASHEISGEDIPMLTQRIHGGLRGSTLFCATVTRLHASENTNFVCGKVFDEKTGEYSLILNEYLPVFTPFSLSLQANVLYEGTTATVTYGNFSGKVATVHHAIVSFSLGFSRGGSISDSEDDVLQAVDGPNGTVFVLGSTVAVYGLNSRTNEVVWGFPTPEVSAARDTMLVTSNVDPSKHYVVITDEVQLRVVDVSSGESLFGSVDSLYQGGCKSYDETGTAFFSADDAFLYIFQSRGCFLRFDLSSGRNDVDALVSIISSKQYDQLVTYSSGGKQFSIIFSSKFNILASIDLTSFQATWKTPVPSTEGDFINFKLLPNNKHCVIASETGVLLVETVSGHVVSEHVVDDGKIKTFELDTGMLGNVYAYCSISVGDEEAVVVQKVKFASPRFKVEWGTAPFDLHGMYVMPSGVLLVTEDRFSQFLLNKSAPNLMQNYSSLGEAASVFPDGDSFVTKGGALYEVASGEELMRFMETVGDAAYDDHFPPRFYSVSSKVYPLSYPLWSIPTSRNDGGQVPILSSDPLPSVFVSKLVKPYILLDSHGFQTPAYNWIVKGDRVVVRNNNIISSVELGDSITPKNASGLTVELESYSTSTGQPVPMFPVGEVILTLSDDNTFLVAVNEAATALLWKVPLPLCQHTTGIPLKGVEIIPDAKTNSIYIHSRDSCLVKFNIDRQVVEGYFLSHNADDPFVGTAAVGRKYAVALTQSCLLHVFDPQGKLSSTVFFGILNGNTHFASTTATITFHGDDFVIVTFPGEVFGVDLEHGVRTWRRPLMGFKGGVARYPYSSSDILIIDISGVERFNVGSEIASFGKRTVWKQKLTFVEPEDRGYSQMSVDVSSDGHVLCAHGDTVFVLDGGTGDVINSTSLTNPNVKAILPLTSTKNSEQWAQLFLAYNDEETQLMLSKTGVVTSVKLKGTTPKTIQSRHAIVSQQPNDAVRVHFLENKLTELGVKQTASFLKVVDASFDARGPNNMQNAPTPRPTFLLQSLPDIPNLGCQVNVEAQYKSFLKTASKLQKELYPKVGNYPVNCSRAAMRIQEIFEDWLSSVTTSDCVYSAYVARDTLSRLVTSSPPFQLCDAPAKCEDAEEGSGAVCRAIHNIKVNVGAGEKDPNFNFPGERKGFMFTFQPKSAQNERSSDSTPRGTKYIIIAICVPATLVVLCSLAIVFYTRHRRQQSRLTEDEPWISSGHEMSSSV